MTVPCATSMPVGLTLLLLAGAVISADTYKWVDERGVTNYGEKPPASRQAKPVNTNMGGVIDTGSQSNQKTDAEVRRSVEVSQKPLNAVPLAQPSYTMAARGMDFDVYIRLQRGMTEGELLLRAGRPDHESLDGFYYDIAKTYYYFPTPANPFTTAVTVRGGRIYDLERIKKF